MVVACWTLMAGCDTCSDNITCTSCINQSYVFASPSCTPCTSLYNDVNCVICDSTYCL